MLLKEKVETAWLEVGTSQPQAPRCKLRAGMGAKGYKADGSKGTKPRAEGAKQGGERTKPQAEALPVAHGPQKGQIWTRSSNAHGPQAMLETE